MTRDRHSDHEAHALVGAYVLDAMDAPERRAFEAHLEGCESCGIEVKELQATAAQLGHAAEAVPPPALRERVLSAIDAIRQDAPVVPLHQGRRRGWRSRTARRVPLGTVAAAVLAFAVVALGGLYVQTSADLDRLEQVAAAGGVGDDLVSVLSAPDAQVREITALASGSARFVWSEGRDLGVLVGDRIGEAPDRHTYALWLIDEGGPHYAGSFTPSDHGLVAAVVSGDLQGADSLGITAEPIGPITHPTGPILMSTVLV
ncbi:MAG: anti-sigma factor [Egibacteraceae bacterium]